MIPQSLNDWNWPAINELLATGHFEDEHFDFKLMLPDSRNHEHKLHLRKVIASFANKEGGFLIYGIDDNKDTKADERIKGVPKNEDYPTMFGNLLNELTPRPDSSFRNPPLVVNPEKVVHVFQIYESMRKPVALEVEKGKFIFPVRSNKGTEEMAYEEIQRNFIGYAHMRDQLRLLIEELKRIASELDFYGASSGKMGNGFIAGSVEYEVVSRCHADTYGILKKSPQLIDRLNRIRTGIGLFNAQLKFHFAKFSTHSHVPLGELTGRASSLKNEIDNYVVDLKEFLASV